MLPFWKALLGGVLLALSQIPFAWLDEYLTRTQLLRRGLTRAYSLFEHGGWIHLVFMAAGIYFILMYYLTPIDPTPASGELITVSVLLSVFAYLSLRKFSPIWVFSEFAQDQFTKTLIVIWLTTGVRSLFLK